MSKWQKCYGKYVANDPCYPFCSLPDGSGCDYAPIIDVNSDNPFGLTEQYSVIYGDDPVTGNYSRRTFTPVIDPYQSQVSPTNFDGMRAFDGGGSCFSFDGSGADCPESFKENLDIGFKYANGVSAYDFNVVPTFDRSDFFNENAPTRYRWRVFD